MTAVNINILYMADMIMNKGNGRQQNILYLLLTDLEWSSWSECRVETKKKASYLRDKIHCKRQKGIQVTMISVNCCIQSTVRYTTVEGPEGIPQWETLRGCGIFKLNKILITHHLSYEN